MNLYLLTLIIIAMVAALFAGLYYLVKGDSQKTATALTIRIGIWVVLFVAIGLYYWLNR